MITMLWDVFNIAGESLCGVIETVISSAFSFLNFLIFGFLPTGLQFLDFTSQGFFFTVQILLAVISTLFEVISGTLKIVSIFLPSKLMEFIDILKYLLHSSMLLVEDFMQTLFSVYETVIWIIESVGNVLSMCVHIIFWCISMIYSAMEFVMRSTFIVTTQFTLGTWCDVNYTINVIAVSVASVWNTAAQIFKRQLTSFVSSQSNVPPRNEFYSFDVDKTEVIVFVILGLVLYVLIYCTTRNIWNSPVVRINNQNQEMNEQNRERVNEHNVERRREGALQPQRREGMDIGLVRERMVDRLETEEQETDWRGITTNLLTRTKKNRTAERRSSVKESRSIPCNSQHSGPSTSRSVSFSPDSREEIHMKFEVKRLEEELAKEVEAKQCVVCLHNPRRLMVKPCNHYCLCELCRRYLTNCPICTAKITNVERIFNV